MADSIPDIILRLARRHLPPDSQAPEPAPALPQHELPMMPAASFPPARQVRAGDVVEPADGLADERRISNDQPSAIETAAHAATSLPGSVDRQNSLPAAMPPNQSGDVPHREIQSPHDASPAADGWRSFSAGATRAPQPTTSPRAESQSTADASALVGFLPPEPTNGFPQSNHGQSDREHFDIFDPAIQFRPNRASAVYDQPDDSFEPFARTTTTNAAAGSHVQSPVDAVGESGRQLEDSARDLETSLTRLFTTQIETLQRLRDKIDEHERRWVEQQSARRATL